MIVYPSELPITAQAFNMVSNLAFNPQNDIVLSIEYSISGTSEGEAGLSFFLATDSSSLTGGMSGADLCYSGSSDGLAQAVIGLGIDSTGTFGLSAGEYYSNSNPLSGTLSAFYRDGYAESDRIPNSATIRSGTSNNYLMSSFNYYHALSNGFNVIPNNWRSGALRFRLGNVGRTLYLDAKDTLDGCYRSICVANIGDVLDVTGTTFYRIGFGFTTPVSANNDDATCQFFFKNVHMEGLVVTLSSLQPLIEVWENILPLWPDVGETWSL